jgi:meso-butanediol dehydrogenase/(S,S)-butanediol dehydrogenase/diacetyl reductase
MEDIKNKIVIVTGGNKGIGRAIAFLLAKRGACVTICGRSTESLETTCKEIREGGGACSSVTADVTNENQVNSVVHKSLCDFGRIDILINNAGVGIFKPIWECSSADWDYVMDTNLKGYFLCSKAVIPIMKKQNEGYILNIASGAGRQGIENLSIYCASKFGTIGLSESMKMDLWKFGIQVDYICPGYVKTDFFKDFPPDYQQMHNGVEATVVAEEVLRRITHRKGTRKFVLNHLRRWLKIGNVIGQGIRRYY